MEKKIYLGNKEIKYDSEKHNYQSFIDYESFGVLTFVKEDWPMSPPKVISIWKEPRWRNPQIL